MTVKELLTRISSQEITEWSIFFKIHSEEYQEAMNKARSGS